MQKKYSTSQGARKVENLCKLLDNLQIKNIVLYIQCNTWIKGFEILTVKGESANIKNATKVQQISKYW